MSKCNTCGSRKVVTCHNCFGKGTIGSIACPQCFEANRVECWICREAELSVLRGQVIKSIDRLWMFDSGRKRHLGRLVNKLFKNPVLKRMIEFAQVNSIKKRINRHDMRHALKVCANVITLFGYVSQCFSETSEAMRIYELASQYGFSAKEVLSGLIIASLAHDIKRGVEEHARTGAEAIEWSDIVDHEIAFAARTREKRNTMRDYVSAWIGNHSGKQKATSVEESLLILGDGLHCEFDRVQPTFDPLFVLTKDHSPMDHFSCRAIRRVAIRMNTRNNSVDCTVYIKGMGASKQVAELVRRYDKTVFKTSKKLEIKMRNIFWRKDNWRKPCVRLRPDPGWSE